MKFQVLIIIIGMPLKMNLGLSSQCDNVHGSLPDDLQHLRVTSGTKTTSGSLHRSSSPHKQSPCIA